jgi:hypothetical protein
MTRSSALLCFALLMPTTRPKDRLKKRTLSEAEAEVQGLVLYQAETRCQWKGFRTEHGSGKQFDSTFPI